MASKTLETTLVLRLKMIKVENKNKLSALNLQIESLKSENEHYVTMPKYNFSGFKIFGSLKNQLNSICLYF